MIDLLTDLDFVKFELMCFHQARIYFSSVMRQLIHFNFRYFEGLLLHQFLKESSRASDVLWAPQAWHYMGKCAIQYNRLDFFQSYVIPYLRRVDVRFSTPIQVLYKDALYKEDGKTPNVQIFDGMSEVYQDFILNYGVPSTLKLMTYN